MATFAWEAANRPEMLPRKPLSKADLEGTAQGRISALIKKGRGMLNVEC
jgi:hypothetical protein